VNVVFKMENYGRTQWSSRERLLSLSFYLFEFLNKYPRVNDFWRWHSWVYHQQ